ncbi:uncharacterized protein LOC126667227 [Mercurialis annua]|uniref:uncharacterized protein LOC126667227 n=1 Tax=Mercurialis annua TaxID=3986 RepID=UPI00215FF7BB|nr:uncharacterized protein LOC126667227 [Mercurialis annua]XP_050216153.1 uncharacterized protein LOC126667227 [Mercurialis annua]
MAKKMMLGVQKRKKSTKRNTKTLLKKVVDYLKSDSYLFAPLVSPYSQTRILASKIVSESSIKGIRMKEKKKNKSLMEKVGEYLKSDSYLYAPMFVPQPLTSSNGVGTYTKRTTVEVFTRKSIRKDNQSTVETSNVTLNDQVVEDDLHGRSLSGQPKLVRKEIVKHMVYQSCRSSSVSGKEMLDLQPRKMVID